MDPAAELITKCGGVAAVAGWLGLSRVAVNLWRRPKDHGGTGGLVPANRQQPLIDAARQAGITIEPADFFASQQSASS
jgi:hypothetical protein